MHTIKDQTFKFNFPTVGFKMQTKEPLNDNESEDTKRPIKLQCMLCEKLMRNAVHLPCCNVAACRACVLIKLAVRKKRLKSHLHNLIPNFLSFSC